MKDDSFIRLNFQNINNVFSLGNGSFVRGLFMHYDINMRSRQFVLRLFTFKKKIKRCCLACNSIQRKQNKSEQFNIITFITNHPSKLNSIMGCYLMQTNIHITL